MENKEQETVEDAAKKEYAYYGGSKPSPYNHLMDTNRLAFIRGANWQKQQEVSLLDQENDIDIVGKCANCGVEFHIHKPSHNRTGLLHERRYGIIVSSGS